MDILNSLALEVFNNKESYTTDDYITIMNILKEQYHRLNGDMPSYYNDDDKDKDFSSENENDDDLSYSNYYADDNEGYLDDYIESY